MDKKNYTTKYQYASGSLNTRDYPEKERINPDRLTLSCIALEWLKFDFLEMQAGTLPHLWRGFFDLYASLQKVQKV